jgi:hypothetical protein
VIISITGKRGLVKSMTENLQRFGFNKVAKVETQEIIDEMATPTPTPPDHRNGYSRGLTRN